MKHLKKFDIFINESFNTRYKWTLELDKTLKESEFSTKSTTEPGHTMVYPKDKSKNEISGYIVNGNVSPVKGVMIAYAVTDEFESFLKENAELIK